MRCLECCHAVPSPSLMVAMEQKQHMALERHIELCGECATSIYRHLNHEAHCSRHWSQCINCALCGSNVPAIRLRFDLKHTGLRHVALCARCYGSLRDEMLARYPNLVAWIDKEWETTEQGTRRLPWARGTVVRVKHRVARYHGRVGVVESFRGLVQPWFGYEVRFNETEHHFFHERDLEVVRAEPARPGGPSSEPLQAA